MLPPAIKFQDPTGYSGMETKQLSEVNLLADDHFSERQALTPSEEPVSTANPRGAGNALQVIIPTETLRGLRMRAADEMTTVRVLVLRALRDAG